MDVEVAGRLTPFNAETPKIGEKTRFRAGSDYSIHLKGNNHAKHIYEKVGFKETDVVDEPDCKEVNMVYLFS